MFAVISIVGLVCLVVLGKDGGDAPTYGGFFGAMEAVSVIKLVSSIRALHDESILKKLYIASTDERNDQIIKAASKTSFTIITLGLSTAIIAASFFSDIVCCTLSVCLFFIIVVYFSVTAYYNRKM